MYKWSVQFDLDQFTKAQTVIKPIHYGLVWLLNRSTLFCAQNQTKLATTIHMGLFWLMQWDWRLPLNFKAFCDKKLIWYN